MALRCRNPERGLITWRHEAEVAAALRRVRRIGAYTFIQLPSSQHSTGRDGYNAASSDSYARLDLIPPFCHSVYEFDGAALSIARELT